MKCGISWTYSATVIFKTPKQTTLQCTYNSIKIEDLLLTGIDRRRIPSAGFMIASWRTVATLPATPEVKKRRKIMYIISSHKMLKNRTETHATFTMSYTTDKGALHFPFLFLKTTAQWTRNKPEPDKL